MFNRREQIALLFLSASLLVGSVATVVDHYDPDRLVDFRVVKSAVEVPGGPQAVDVADESDVEEGESPAATTEVHASLAAVSINTATAVQLTTLPSIGPATAARIVEYRSHHGRFASLEALQQVNGIGPRTVEKLRSFTSLE